MKIEILSILEDYVTKTIFTSALLNGLLVLVAPIFEADRRNFTRELNVFFLKMLCTYARKKDGTLSVYKSSSVKYIWEPPLIVSFGRPLNKPFSVTSDPTFTESK